MNNRVLIRSLLLFGIAAYAVLEMPRVMAQSQELKELRTTLELVFMCSVKNSSTPDVKKYFESTEDKTLQREWNRAIVKSQQQMLDAQKSGGRAAVRGLQRYELSCTLLDAATNLPIGLQSALHK